MIEKAISFACIIVAGANALDMDIMNMDLDESMFG